MLGFKLNHLSKRSFCRHIAIINIQIMLIDGNLKGWIMHGNWQGCLRSHVIKWNNKTPTFEFNHVLFSLSTKWIGLSERPDIIWLPLFWGCVKHCITLRMPDCRRLLRDTHILYNSAINNAFWNHCINIWYMHIYIYTHNALTNVLTLKRW